MYFSLFSFSQRLLIIKTKSFLRFNIRYYLLDDELQFRSIQFFKTYY